MQRHLNIKQELELQILFNKSKTHRLILTTLENINKNYLTTKLITPKFFDLISANRAKFPLFLYHFKDKSEVLKNINKKKACVIILDNNILKNKTIKRLLILEETVITFLKEYSSNANPVT